MRKINNLKTLSLIALGDYAFCEADFENSEIKNYNQKFLDCRDGILMNPYKTRGSNTYSNGRSKKIMMTRNTNHLVAAGNWNQPQVQPRSQRTQNRQNAGNHGEQKTDIKMINNMSKDKKQKSRGPPKRQRNSLSLTSWNGKSTAPPSNPLMTQTNSGQHDDLNNSMEQLGSAQRFENANSSYVGKEIKVQYVNFLIPSLSSTGELEDVKIQVKRSGDYKEAYDYANIPSKHDMTNMHMSVLHIQSTQKNQMFIPIKGYQEPILFREDIIFLRQMTDPKAIRKLSPRRKFYLATNIFSGMLEKPFLYTRGEWQHPNV